MIINTKLSQNFSLAEMVRSRVAARVGIDNTPTDPDIKNLYRVVNSILQPLRNGIGPVIVSSGFRCSELNKRIGGASNSAHITGRAADIESVSLSTPQLAYKLVEFGLEFDKLILEYWDEGSDFNDGWVHLQVSKDNKEARKLIYHKTKTKNYVPITPEELSNLI